MLQLLPRLQHQLIFLQGRGQHVASATKTKQEPSVKIVHCLYVELAQNKCVIHVLGQTQTFELESVLF